MPHIHIILQCHLLWRHEQFRVAWINSKLVHVSMFVVGILQIFDHELIQLASLIRIIQGAPQTNWFWWATIVKYGAILHFESFSLECINKYGSAHRDSTYTFNVSSSFWRFVLDRLWINTPFGCHPNVTVFFHRTHQRYLIMIFWNSEFSKQTFYARTWNQFFVDPDLQISQINLSFRREMMQADERLCSHTKIIECELIAKWFYGEHL